MEKKEIIDKYEFDEVVSGHMIMSEPDLYNIMDLWAEECLEEKLKEIEKLKELL